MKTLNKDELIIKLKSAGIAYLSTSYKTEKEVQVKLLKYLDKLSKIYDLPEDLNNSEIIDHIVENFRNTGLIDEIEYIAVYIRSAIKKSTPKSPLEVKKFLYRKGIDSASIEIALNKYYFPKEEEVLKKIIQKKHKLDEKKLYKYLVSKGFRYSAVQSVFRDFFS